MLVRYNVRVLGIGMVFGIGGCSGGEESALGKYIYLP